MASTDQRTGFHLSWGGPPAEPAQPEPATDQTPTAGSAAPEAAAVEASPTPEPATDETSAAESAAPEAAAVEVVAETSPTPEPATVRRPARFLADLVRAMRAAADENRAATLTAFNDEAKSFVAGIHARSATEMEGLRRLADDEIIAVKEWSKAEISRIRVETEERIGGRRTDLELNLEGHAALIEREIEQVQSRISTFESQMDAFFGSLESVQDPAEFAAVAAEMPDPPTLEAADASARSEVLAALMRESAQAAARAESEARAESAAAASGEIGEDEATPAPSDPDVDPRLTALGLRPTVDDVTASEGVDASEAIEELTEASLAARLGDLESASKNGKDGPSMTTNVVVVGLVSVASIASFKRHLAKLSGVQSVGVSSGPDGEFVFKASHDPDVSLADVVPSLPGFAARVVATSEGVLSISARDPESEA